MLKKYGIGLLAVIIAATSSAFTIKANHPSVDKYVFEFDPTVANDYTKSRVETETGTIWVYKGKNLTLCAGINTKACRVSVTSAYVNNAAAPTALSGVTITGTESSTGVAFVSNITDPTNNAISNKP